MTVAVVTGFVGQYGTEALAGYGLGARLELMLVPISFGIGAALTASVGVNVGAGQFTRARKVAWAGAGATFILTGTIGVVVFFVPSLWLDLFTTDAEAYSIGLLYLAIAAPAYGFFGGGQALYFASQGTGKVTLPVIVTLLRLLTVTAISVASTQFGWGIGGLFTGVATGLVVMGIGQALCLNGSAWHSAK
jgi:Na+-driven multidrug efflux pump